MRAHIDSELSEAGGVSWCLGCWDSVGEGHQNCLSPGQQCVCEARVCEAASGSAASRVGRTCEGASGVGDAHHNTRILGGDVHVIHREATTCAAAAAQRKGRHQDAQPHARRQRHEHQRPCCTPETCTHPPRMLFCSHPCIAWHSIALLQQAQHFMCKNAGHQFTS